jgi:hypothetical protein
MSEEVIQQMEWQACQSKSVIMQQRIKEVPSVVKYQTGRYMLPPARGAIAAVKSN